MEMQVIKSKSTIDLQKHEEELRARLFALRIQKAVGKLDTPHEIKDLRKDIARIKTELQERKSKGEVIKPLDVRKMTLPKHEEDKKTVKKDLKAAKKINKENKKIQTEIKEPSTSKKEEITTDSTPKEENNNDKQ